ncbi:MAG: hypothetical protein ED557_03060 [Balneola sp.]|nr:MAG: hypothetical protein ED557_03060 [Balneola sp.]
MASFNTIEEVFQFLNEIPMFSKSGITAINLGLENISLFCDKIGNPQHNFRSIHVAGTNGKGSTCYLLEHVYRNSGFKTGLFTSPHLLRYNERFKINGKDIEDETILRFFNSYGSLIKETRLSYFEISTALAFWLFSEKKVDIAIIETGLGGRLDATNIISPLISVITSISRDHEQILGSSLKEIALEKAGIIKEGVPVVIGNIKGEALEAIEEVVEGVGTILLLSSDLDPVFKDKTIGLNTLANPIGTNFLEPVNAWNTAIVYMVIDTLKPNYPVEDSSFVHSISSFSGVPARFEKLTIDNNWYFSGSHNIDAIRSMLDGLKQIAGSKTLILSLLNDKVNVELLSLFEDFEQVFFYKMDSERAASYEDINQILSCKPITEQSYHTILKEIDTEVVIFAGSFYFYPVVKRWIVQNNF